MERKKLVESFFRGDKNFKKVYLPPPTSQKDVPQEITELNKILENMKINEERRSIERLDKWLAERNQAMGN